MLSALDLEALTISAADDLSSSIFKLNLRCASDRTLIISESLLRKVKLGLVSFADLDFSNLMLLLESSGGFLVSV